MKALSITFLLSVPMAQLAYAADQEEKGKQFEKFFEQHRRPVVSEREQQHQQRLQEYPMLRKSEEILHAFVRSEAELYDKFGMQARIAKERAEWNERQRHVLTEVMVYFSVPIRRIFREDTQDPVARLVIETVKEYEKTQGWGFSLCYAWKQNDDNTRSLECIVDATPETLMAAYNSSQNE